MHSCLTDRTSMIDVLLRKCVDLQGYNPITPKGLLPEFKRVPQHITIKGKEQMDTFELWCYESSANVIKLYKTVRSIGLKSFLWLITITCYNSIHFLHTRWVTAGALPRYQTLPTELSVQIMNTWAEKKSDLLRHEHIRREAENYDSHGALQQEASHHLA